MPTDRPHVRPNRTVRPDASTAPLSCQATARTTRMAAKTTHRRIHLIRWIAIRIITTAAATTIPTNQSNRTAQTITRAATTTSSTTAPPSCNRTVRLWTALRCTVRKRTRATTSPNIVCIRATRSSRPPHRATRRTRRSISRIRWIRCSAPSTMITMRRCRHRTIITAITIVQWATTMRWVTIMRRITLNLTTTHKRLTKNRTQPTAIITTTRTRSTMSTAAIRTIRTVVRPAGTSKGRAAFRVRPAVTAWWTIWWQTIRTGASMRRIRSTMCEAVRSTWIACWTAKQEFRI